ncbi:MAG TPA: hypothetical protein VJG90_08230, partial [Candidatus Nanoarchaeia archaeon]|nr:hypothetical protein [Candidatus Nanoarchaeia archaeon]
MPESMAECLYFTRRAVGNSKTVAWVLKEPCPKCKKGMMGKPIEKGKVKIRATEYVCPDCGYSEEKGVYEAKLTCNVQYTCAKCVHSGETTAPFKRKSFQGVKAIVFECQSCHEQIPITKKMKEIKKKDKGGTAAAADADDDDF